MSRVRARGEKIRRFIIANVQDHPRDIAKKTAAKFGITRQAVNKHLQHLVAEEMLEQEGATRSRVYRLRPQTEFKQLYPLGELTESDVWNRDIRTALEPLPENVMDIWSYGFSEMFNNAIDHSEGSRVFVEFQKTPAFTEMLIYDDGVGIFQKITKELGLVDKRHAILELAKGKLTTDPEHHSGEGIFFTSRMFDKFDILSSAIYFNHAFGDSHDWILEDDDRSSGTAVWLQLGNHSSRTLRRVFNRFTTDEDFGFTKTIVPVRLAQYGDDKLVSRSQAKRLLTRIDRFKTVILNFTGVDTIGQAFGDEIFRVFKNAHPEVELLYTGANKAVTEMITRTGTDVRSM